MFIYIDIFQLVPRILINRSKVSVGTGHYFVFAALRYNEGVNNQLKLAYNINYLQSKVAFSSGYWNPISYRGSLYDLVSYRYRI